MKQIKRRVTYIIKDSDVGKGRFGMLKDRIPSKVEFDKCPHCGRPAEEIVVDFSFMGGVQKGDVGKMMVYNPEHNLWNVENDAQFEKRIYNLKNI